MFQRLWTDSTTIRLHVRLFRCFLFDFLAELAFSERLLANLGLTHDVHGPVSHRASPEGPDSNAKIRCPPKWRYEATPLPSFALSVPMESFVGIVPPFLSQPIAVSHSLYHHRIQSAAASRGYGGPLSGVLGYILLWMLTLALVLRCSSIASGTRGVCRSLRAAKSKTPNSDKRMIGSSAEQRLSTHDGVERLAIAKEAIRGRLFAFGLRITCRVQSTMKTLRGFIRHGMQPSWTLFSQIGTKAWTRILDLAANPPSTYGSKNHEDGRSFVCPKLGSRKLGSHSGTSMLATSTENEGVEPAVDRSASGSTTAIDDQHRLPSAINDMAVGLILAEVTVSDEVCEATSSWRKMGSVVDATNMNLNLHTALSPDRDNTSGFGSASSGNDVSLGVGTLRAVMSPSEGRDGYGGLESPLSFRRERGVFDDDEETGDDSYWTEQVYTRLSGDFHLEGRQYGWSEASSWPREGCEDASENWRIKNSQILAESVGPDDTCGVHPGDSKPRRYSYPCLNMNPSLSHRTASDGPQEVYVIPQKRGRATGGRCWSPESGLRLSDHPGLGFLPFRETPTLLTPTAWKPGCLYIPDPPEDESRQAVAWWDELTSLGRCDTGSVAGHLPVIRDGPLHARAVLFPQGRQPGGPVSWRDRYENDPASRRFVSVHRRAVTDG